ncbi:Cysteine--tRNA ligase [Nosema granulosis]|uniref:cysteine--tRNA ligase n=1 Tax=Nosema granulosis TaxID=83296 RepID=A0A9P6H0A6_9MICR|nr:Cysteine--tRNA ligase [Nosema granulosis]
MKNTLKIYNTITKKMESFIPNDPKTIKMYICGPTVYDDSHIGHGRTYVMFDVIRSILEKYYNYNVVLVMNITDIDDKIINKANASGLNAYDVTKKYTKEFLEDMCSLNVRLPTRLTKVTDYIEKIGLFIKKLESNGFAYRSNGSVYFDVEKYKKAYDYPIFKSAEGINLDACNVSEKNMVSEKRNVADFALWKAAKKNELYFEYDGLKGRPGWHIECSVMASDVIGESIDIHAGGVDLKFPHHENEIAQCQAYYQSRPWIKYFLHSGHLNIDGLKMSKSLKNFTTIREILKTSTPNQLRILFLNHQWSKDMNYETEELKFAQNYEKKIKNFISYANSKRYDAYEDTLSDKMFNETKDFEILQMLEKTENDIDLSFSNNFDTPEVLKSISELISSTNSAIKEISILTLFTVRDFINKILDILGIEGPKATESSGDAEALADILSSFRNKVRGFAKEGRDSKELYGLCDELREILKAKGFVIEDSKLSSVIKRF